jgi:hypothetical protein
MRIMSTQLHAVHILPPVFLRDLPGTHAVQATKRRFCRRRNGRSTCKTDTQVEGVAPRGRKPYVRQGQDRFALLVRMDEDASKDAAAVWVSQFDDKMVMRVHAHSL